MDKPTKEEQLVALQESIEHWQAMLILPIKQINMTSDACTCCTLAERYTPQEKENLFAKEIDCKFCPITTIDAEYDGCIDTPFYDARDAYYELHFERMDDRSIMDRRIMNEIEFLKDVKAKIEELVK